MRANETELAEPGSQLLSGEIGSRTARRHATETPAARTPAPPAAPAPAPAPVLALRLALIEE